MKRYGAVLLAIAAGAPASARQQSVALPQDTRPHTKVFTGSEASPPTDLRPEGEIEGHNAGLSTRLSDSVQCGKKRGCVRFVNYTPYDIIGLYVDSRPDLPKPDRSAPSLFGGAHYTLKRRMVTKSPREACGVGQGGVLYRCSAIRFERTWPCQVSIWAKMTDPSFPHDPPTYSAVLHYELCADIADSRTHTENVIFALVTDLVPASPPPPKPQP